MEIDESKIEEWDEPTVWQKLKNSVIALIFGGFLVIITPMRFALLAPFDSTISYVLTGTYAIVCLLLGWFYGDDFRAYLHAKIVKWWDPRDMFR